MVLRAPTGEDVAAYAKLFGDEDTARYIRDRGPTGAKAIADEIGEYAVDFDQGWAIYWSCIEKQTDMFVGFAAMHEPNSRTPILSYAILPDKRRQGFATEAIQAVLSYASTLPGVDAIVAHVHLDNEPSVVLLRSLGFEDMGNVQLPGGTRRGFRWARRLLADSPEQ